MATNIMEIMAKFALINSVNIWPYEYDIYSVMTGVQPITIF